jgi:hypothetical protein
MGARARHHVVISVQDQGDGSVTEKLVHELRMVPPTEQQVGTSGRKVMEADVRYACACQERLDDRVAKAGDRLK